MCINEQINKGNSIGKLPAFSNCHGSRAAETGRMRTDIFEYGGQFGAAGTRSLLLKHNFAIFITLFENSADGYKRLKKCGLFKFLFFFPRFQWAQRYACLCGRTLGGKEYEIVREYVIYWVIRCTTCILFNMPFCKPNPPIHSVLPEYLLYLFSFSFIPFVSL